MIPPGGWGDSSRLIDFAAMQARRRPVTRPTTSARRRAARPPSRALSRALAGAALLGLVSGCERVRPAGPYELYATLRRAEQVTLVVAPELLEQARALEGSEAPGGVGLTVRSAERPGGRGPRLLIGTWTTPGMAAVAEHLGIELASDAAEGARFRFAAHPELEPFDLLVATCADPDRRGLPLGVVLAGDPEAARPWLRRCSAGARLGFEPGALPAAGRLDVDGALTGVSTTARTRLGHARERRAARGIELLADPGCAPYLEDYLADLRRVRKTLLNLTDSPKANPPAVRVRAFGHPQDLAFATGRWELSGRNPRTGAVHAYVAEGLDDAGAGYADSFARALLGPPAAEWVAGGLAVHAAGSWWGRPLPDWVGRLAAADLVPEDVEPVLEPPRDPVLGQVRDRLPSAPLSQHVVAPLRGAFVRHLLDVEGRELRELWAGGDAASLATSWRAFREELQAGGAERAELRASQAEAARLRLAERGFLRGANLIAPRTGELSTGFGSRGAERSLQALRSTGANAVTVCFEAVARASGPRAAFEPVARGPLVSDLALVGTMRAAAKRDLAVMLRPFLFETASGTWAGDHAEESEERHEAFFAHYRELLVHAALLAELSGAELLCVGGQLPKTTRTDPEGDPWVPDFTNENHDRWRGLIATTRALFAGSLTYGADGFGEGERIGFWAELDFVGQQLFRSLTVQPGELRPTDDELRRRLINLLRGTAALGASAARPALVVEVGFPASSEGWLQPSETRGEPDLLEQARMMEGLFRALVSLERSGKLAATPEEGRLGGLFLWCWSTDPEAGEAPDESHTPQNRPALEWVRRMFRMPG